MTITAHSLTLNKTITSTGSEPELQVEDQHITTQLGHWCARMNEQAHQGASDWIATVELPGPERA